MFDFIAYSFQVKDLFEIKTLYMQIILFNMYNYKMTN